MSKMGDAAAARREARRRKILENSGNRLQKIAGKSDDDCPRESPIRSRPITEPDYEIPVSAPSSSYSKTSQFNGVLRNEAEPFPFIPSHDFDAAGDIEVTSDLASFVSPTPAEPASSVPVVPLWEKITTYKYDIVLLSLFIQMLYGMSVITFDRGAYFFLPVIVYVVTKLVWFPVQNTSNIANVLLLLNGMSQSRVRNILYLTQCFSVISRDTFVYLFTTICIQSLWIMMRDLVT